MQSSITTRNFKSFAHPLVTLLALLGSALAEAQIVDTGSIEIENSTRYVIHSEHTNEAYQIDVSRVGTTSPSFQSGQELPVVYVLDGNSQFQVVSSIANILTASRMFGIGDGIPPVLIVSIGYSPDPNLSDLENLGRRTRVQRNKDFTPVLPQDYLDSNPNMSPSGGAENFHKFIESELKPFIGRQFADIDSNNQTLLGHSLGGLFVLHILATAPETFNNYIATSPGVSWGGFYPLGEDVEFGTDSADSLVNVFVSIGGSESENDVEGAMWVNSKLQESALDINLTFETFPNEDHFSVIPAATARGLIEVFN